MVRKTPSIVLIIMGLVITAEVALYFSEYSRMHKVFESCFIEGINIELINFSIKVYESCV